MRTIKFRAKSFEGEWVYGDLHLNCKFPHIHTQERRSVPIDTTTIGEFTGLHDKNGKEIYEGDIIMTGSGFYGVIKWSKYGYFYIHSDGDKEDPLDYATLGYMLRQYDFEVIGNIHDNPELLEKGGQDERD